MLRLTREFSKAYLVCEPNKRLAVFFLSSTRTGFVCEVICFVIVYLPKHMLEIWVCKDNGIPGVRQYHRVCVTFSLITTSAEL